MYRVNEAVAEHLDAPIWNRRPDRQDEKELLGICAKDYVQNSEAQSTPAFPGKQTISRIWWCSAQTCCNGKCTSRSVRKRMPGRCHSRWKIQR